MTKSVCGTYKFYDDQWQPLSVIYADYDATCDHQYRTYVRSQTRDGRDQVYEACVACGKYTSASLKHADHPNRATYPSLDSRYTRSIGGYPRQHLRCRSLEYVVNSTNDSGGYEWDPVTLWHKDDLSNGARCIDSWNRALDSIPTSHVPRERARAMQFGLVDLWYHDQIVDVSLAVNFDAHTYEQAIGDALSSLGIPVVEVCADTDVDGSYTRFGDGFRYADYLSSTQWEVKRHRAINWSPNSLSSQNGAPYCEAPYCAGNGDKVDCHHLTYARAGHEEPGDLIFLCSSCHENAEYLKRVTPGVIAA